MKEVMFSEKKDLIKILDDYNIDIKRTISKTYAAEIVKLSIAHFLFLVSCGALNLELPAYLISSIVAYLMARKTLDNKMEELREKLQKDKINAKKCLNSLSFELHQFNKSLNFEDLMLLNEMISKDKTEIIYELGFYSDNEFNVLRQIKKYDGKDLKLCKYYLYDKDECTSDMEHFKREKSLILKK